MVEAPDTPYIRLVAEENSVLRSGLTHCSFGHELPGSTPERDGVFASWSFDGRRLTVETDRYGMYPLFVYSTRDEIAVSPSIATLLHLGTPAQFDLDALCVFFHIGFFLGEETPFRAIRALPPGGRIEWTPDGVVSTGATFHRPPRNMDRSKAVDAYVELFREAMRKRPPRERVAVPLSGGRDSRHILFELAAANRLPDACVTARYFPPRANEDARIAPTLAAAFGIPHVLLDQGPEFETERDKNVATSYCADEHAWFDVVAKFLGNDFGSVYDGIGGDVLSAGLYLTRNRVAMQSRGDYGELAEIFLSPRAAATLSRVLPREARTTLSRKRAIERIATELTAHAEAANPIGSFCFWNRTRREIALAPYAMGPTTPTVYAPYLDHELYDFLVSLPASMLSDRRLHTDAIHRAFPEYAHLEFERADARPTDARVQDRTFTSALLRSEFLQHTHGRTFVAAGLRRRLRTASLLDRVRPEDARLDPRIVLYMCQLERAAGST